MIKGGWCGFQVTAVNIELWDLQFDRDGAEFAHQRTLAHTTGAKDAKQVERGFRRSERCTKKLFLCFSTNDTELSRRTKMIG
jgi:hypothetical protein